MRTLLFLLLILPGVSLGQKIYLIDNGTKIDQKAKAALNYDYDLVSKDSADYSIEIFFTGAYSLGKGYRGHYRLYDRKGKEIYRSEEWKAGGYGGVAENYIIKKAVKKDLPKALKSLANTK